MLPLTPRPGLALVVAGLLGGCVVGPDYAGPPVAAPRAETGAPFVRANATRTVPVDPPARWWTSLRDPILTELVEEALATNTNVQVAAARLRQSRAMLSQRTADLAPSISANTVALNNQFPVKDFIGSGLTRGLGAAAASSGAVTIPKSVNTDLYDASFDATWEIDIFGGKQRAIEQAAAQGEAAEAAVADAQVQVAAEVAQAYVTLRGAQRRLALTLRAASLQREAVNLSQQRLAQGAASTLDVERLRTQFETTASQAPAFQAQIDQSLNQIAVLVSREPGAVDALLKPPRAIPVPPPTLAVGDPASLIRRRPDIRRAERQVAAANAQVGQSVAKLFPKVTLLGNAGWVSPNIGSIGTLAASTYSVGPTLSWNILDFGRTLAQIRQSEAGTDEALAQYEQTVLQALQDAETALSRYGHQRATVARLARASASAGKASMLTDQRNTAGTVSTIDVLDVERQRLQAEQGLAQAQAEYTNDYVALQKSLGLGWGLPDERVAMVRR
ncbi:MULTISPECIES: efflux transporter outer membrane subunit [unclassified Methylobacterium]|jgi:outer membrane protein, multidrug efflux system|uniref:efflux transporter outer membrane subunit n=1 Tax=unclassified Methylobacterium TaxID=2615210 RepID=UPI00135568F0|nr:efflux transporter outer membrane subunit [Methylobacterium sp. 2A]MWV24970.1 efflux transporter outer membrane subunit [Methylobacterium sp. 2A]